MGPAKSKNHKTKENDGTAPTPHSLATPRQPAFAKRRIDDLCLKGILVWVGPRSSILGAYTSPDFR
jgi:hypothetical protein